MSPTSIGGGGEYHNRRELISPASCDAKLVPVGKGREEDLPAANLEQWPYKKEFCARKDDMLTWRVFPVFSCSSLQTGAMWRWLC